MPPPLGTIHIKLLPSSDTAILVGVDLHFFNVNSTLRGIKLLPAGLHFFHYSQNEGSIRSGWWINVQEGMVLTCEWNKNHERFDALGYSGDDVIATDYAYMVKYPSVEDMQWHVLTEHVDMEAVEEFVPPVPEQITTATPSKEENMVLLDALQQRDPQQTFQDQHNKQLNYTIIQERQQGPNPQHLVETITANALDRTWQLEHLYGHDHELLLAELEICFVHFITVGNVCSLTQHMALLLLVLKSEGFLRQHQLFCNAFTTVLIQQLETIPEEYIRPTGLEVVDTKQMCQVLENLLAILTGTAEWMRLSEVCERKMGISLSALERRFDEDNYEVYDLDNHDSEDEEAPAVV